MWACFGSELRIARVEERTEYAHKLDDYFKQKSATHETEHSVHARIDYTLDKQQGRTSATPCHTLPSSRQPIDSLQPLRSLVLRAPCPTCREVEKKQLLEDVLHGAVEKRKAKFAKAEQ